MCKGSRNLEGFLLFFVLPCVAYLIVAALSLLIK